MRNKFWRANLIHDWVITDLLHGNAMAHNIIIYVWETAQVVKIEATGATLTYFHVLWLANQI